MGKAGKRAQCILGISSKGVVGGQGLHNADMCLKGSG